MVKMIAAKQQPDLLIVSGDLVNQPVPWQMRRAARFVEELRDVCPKDTKVIVIPGNHDFKFYGNIGLRRFTRIPFEIYFRRDGLNKTLPQRAWDYLVLSLHALYPRSRLLREPLQFEYIAEKGLAVAAFNSNTLVEMMAAGRVENRDLQAFYGSYDKAAQTPAFAFSYKLAVVHHHAAPLADVSTDFAARLEESFMIFYNAGMFLRELKRRRFNLVLHGHKHVAGFVRVATDFPSGERA